MLVGPFLYALFFFLQVNLTLQSGADVSHPGPGSTLPSVSGVVSSMDELATRYTATTNVQETRVERIVDLAEMMAVCVFDKVHSRRCLYLVHRMLLKCFGNSR